MLLDQLVATVAIMQDTTVVVVLYVQNQVVLMDVGNLKYVAAITQTQLVLDVNIG